MYYVCVCVCAIFITSVDLCIYHHSEDTELFHHGFGIFNKQLR